ncbi:hypothetical protein NT6N_05930 [Oceaniferula spumae]|uniref:Nucleotidyl transferase AbiEii/AbiGii toxin family protein n=1 Tax=Oceaniferula spumae TaxID=2979115 RepID=A0AAT9FHU2_9BACT
MTTPIESSFEKLLVLLVQNDVEFTTVGGIAVCLNGYVRLTEDVDILVAPAKDNILRLIDVLSGFGEGFAAGLTPDDFSDEEGAIRVIEATENCHVDIFTRMQGLYLEDFRDDIQHFETSDGALVPYLGSKSLVRLKSTSLREKDRVDVSVLKGILGSE